MTNLLTNTYRLFVSTKNTCYQLCTAKKTLKKRQRHGGVGRPISDERKSVHRQLSREHGFHAALCSCSDCICSRSCCVWCVHRNGRPFPWKILLSTTMLTLCRSDSLRVNDRHRCSRMRAPVALQKFAVCC